MTVKEVLEEKFNGIGGNFQTHLAPNIPEKKLQNAAQYIAEGIDRNKILGICDFTLFNSAKNGLVFTETTFYSRNFAGRVAFEYKKIKKVDVQENSVFVYGEEGVIFSAGCYDSRKLADLFSALADNGETAGSGKTEDEILENTTESQEEQGTLENAPKEDSPTFSFDCTMNQHQLPLQSKEGEVNSFLGLQFGSSILENVFQLRCLGWKLSRMYSGKKIFGKQTTTCVYNNGDSFFCGQKIEAIRLSYVFMNQGELGLTTIVVVFESGDTYTALVRAVFKKLIETYHLEQRYNALVSTKTPYVISAGTLQGNTYSYLCFSEGKLNEYLATEYYRKPFFAAHYQSLGAMNISSFFIDVGIPTGDVADEKEQDLQISFFIALLFLDADRQKRLFSCYRTKKKVKQVIELAEKIQGVFDAPRESFDKNEAIERIRNIVDEQIASAQEKTKAKKTQRTGKSAHPAESKQSAIEQNALSTAKKPIQQDESVPSVKPDVQWIKEMGEYNGLGLSVTVVQQAALADKAKKIQELPKGAYTTFLAPNIDKTILRNALQFIIKTTAEPMPILEDDVLAVCLVDAELQGFHSVIFTKTALYVKTDGYYRRMYWSAINGITLQENTLTIAAHEQITFTTCFNTMEFFQFLIDFVKVARIQDRQVAVNAMAEKDFARIADWENYLPYLADYTDEMGNDMLMLAYIYRQKELVQHLLATLPRTYAHANKLGETFLTLAVTADDTEIVGSYFGFNGHKLLPADLYARIKSANKDYSFSKKLDTGLGIAGSIIGGVFSVLTDSMREFEDFQAESRTERYYNEQERKSQLDSKIKNVFIDLYESYDKEEILDKINTLKWKLQTEQKGIQESENKISNEIIALKAAKYALLSEPKGEFETTADYEVRLQKAKSIDKIFEVEYAEEIKNLKTTLQVDVDSNISQAKSRIETLSKELAYYAKLLEMEALEDMQMSVSQKIKGVHSVYYQPRLALASHITIGTYNADEQFFPIVFEMHKSCKKYTYKMAMPISLAPMFKKEFSEKDLASQMSSDICFSDGTIVEKLAVTYKDTEYILEFIGEQEYCPQKKDAKQSANKIKSNKKKKYNVSVGNIGADAIYFPSLKYFYSQSDSEQKHLTVCSARMNNAVALSKLLHSWNEIFCKDFVATTSKKIKPIRWFYEEDVEEDDDDNVDMLFTSDDDKIIIREQDLSYRVPSMKNIRIERTDKDNKTLILEYTYDNDREGNISDLEKILDFRGYKLCLSENMSKPKAVLYFPREELLSLEDALALIGGELNNFSENYVRFFKELTKKQKKN